MPRISNFHARWPRSTRGAMAPLLQPSLEQFHHAGSFAAEHQETTRTPPRCFFFFFRAEDADIRDLSTPGAASEGSEDAAAAVGDLLTSAH